MKIRCGLTDWILIAAIVITSANADLQQYSPPVIDDSTPEIDNSKCEWSDWNLEDCSVTCGGGTRYKNRIALPKDENVDECGDYDAKIEICNTSECPICITKPCPVNCIWGEWKIGTCSKTCGPGRRTDVRTKEAIEENGGTCQGKSSRTRNCQVKPCKRIPIDCCREKGVRFDCLGNCASVAPTAQRDFIHDRSLQGLCKQYEKIIDECNSGSEDGKYN